MYCTPTRYVSMHPLNNCGLLFGSKNYITSGTNPGDLAVLRVGSRNGQVPRNLNPGLLACCMSSMVDELITWSK
jgi:hypothetical protein